MMARPLNGFLLLDKPLGYSSHAVTRRVRRIAKMEKAGHTGSLDPLATGMLPIALGEATKFSRFLFEANKAYAVTMCLGVTTTTGDSEGEIVHTGSVPRVTDEMLAAMRTQFLGEQTQIPPMYSAIKYKGQPLYRLARAGKIVERAPRAIRIEALAFDSPHTFTVVCSKGTYVRSLVMAMGEYLGCGAHVTALRRLWVDPFQAAAMVTIPEWEQASEVERRAWVYSIPALLSKFFPMIAVSADHARAIQKGQSVAYDGPHSDLWVGLLWDEQFLGVAENREGKLAPRRLVCHDDRSSHCDY